VTELPLYGGIRFPLAIGAVVEGVLNNFQTPLSGHISPVLAVLLTAIKYDLYFPQRRK
jgi:hypothetical protein